MAPLHLGVVLAGAWCVTALVVEFRRVRAFGIRRLFAPSAGDAAAGVRYAFTWAMAPQAKESVRDNPLSYAAGMAYHGGVFAAFALLALRLMGLNLGGLHLSRILACVTLAGALGGLALLAKRLLKAHLRGLSCPDDYLSNLLATAFAALAGAAVLEPALETAWMGVAIALLVYLPLGKIRHCVFFFSTRYHSGAFFGRRGVFPPGRNRA